MDGQRKRTLWVRRWYHDPRWRLVVAFTLGLLSVILVLSVMHWSVLHAILIAWSILAFVYCAITTLAVWRMNPEQTAAHAKSEDLGGMGAHIMLLVASGASLVGLITLLVRNETTMVAPALLTFIVVVASWATIQVTYTLRYARLYYERNSGISFGQDDDPQYSDFAYLAFTMGMAFQVSDTQFNNSMIRRSALGHAILTYVFGTVILASAINIVTSLSGAH
jgi:uncharacterized membrane protein